MTKIFLDDERFPVTDDFVICRNYTEFMAVVRTYQNIKFISFDHDLGPDETGHDCVKFLVNYDIDADILDAEFTFYVHSQNPTGARNIQNYLDDYLGKKRAGFFG